MGFPIVPLSPQGVTSGAAIGVSLVALVDELKLAVASIAGLDPVSGAFVPGLGERAFQFWPATVDDTLASGWVSKPIPGASHSLMQWGSNEGRTITFELPLRRYMDYEQDGVLALKADPTNAWNRPFNSNIDFAIKYFRAFMYPIKTENAAAMQAPPIAILNFPGMSLNEDGGDHLFTVMTQCDVTYEKGMSRRGFTKSAKLSLAFKQVIQGAEGTFNFKSIGSGGNYYDLTKVQKAGATLEGVHQISGAAVAAPGHIKGTEKP
jgi:hypothetical protein